MKKACGILKAAFAANVLLIIGELISFAVWTAVAVKRSAEQSVYWWTPMTLIFVLSATVAVAIERMKIKKGAYAEAATLSLATVMLSFFDISLCNMHFIEVLGLSLSFDMSKGVNFIIIFAFYILDIICFLSSKDYAVFVNLDSFMQNAKLRHKYGIIGGATLAVCNTICLIVAMFVSSYIVAIVACIANTAAIFASMAICAKKYGEKNYYL